MHWSHRYTFRLNVIITSPISQTEGNIGYVLTKFHHLWAYFHWNDMEMTCEIAYTGALPLKWHLKWYVSFLVYSEKAAMCLFFNSMYSLVICPMNTMQYSCCNNNVFVWYALIDIFGMILCLCPRLILKLKALQNPRNQVNITISLEWL